MTPEQRRRIRDAFEQALEVPRDDVDRWLAAAVPDDPAVRAEVASLLEHERRAGAFLIEPAVVSTGPGAREPLRSGAEIGPYRIVREIGRGGMGCVYLADDRRLGRPVALKVIAPDLAGDAVWRERLWREARAMAALTHPAICGVYALEQFDDEICLVTEFIDGPTLREEIESGALPSAELAVRTAVDLAAALASAHARGITHRDLKPGNVMRTADGRIKVLDFGLARQERGAASFGVPVTLTAPGTAIGTPAYMAPEQLNAGVVDARADIFALGVLMYEYVTGVHPFDAATSAAMLARILDGEPLPVETRRPDLPSALAAAITRCLKKQPGDRFQSAGEIAAALMRPPESARGEHRRWWRVHQIAVVVLYAIACVVSWNLKEHARTPASTWAFVVVGVLAASGGMMRGHLLFTEWTAPGRLTIERHRTRRGETAVDLLLPIVLFGEGLFLAPFRPVTSVLTMALAIGIGAAAILIEPSTAATAFHEPPEARR